MNDKTGFGGFALLFATSLAMGCATTSVIKPHSVDLPQIPVGARKPRIAVMEFQDKTSAPGKYQNQFGRGMVDMLTTALVRTQRCRVLERDRVEAILAEGAFGRSVFVDPSTAAEVGKVLGAELLVLGAVTGFEPEASGGGVKIFGLPLDGRVGGGFKQAHVAVDLKVIDSGTAEIVAVATVEGTATSAAAGGEMIGGDLSPQLTVFKKTPMDTAIRLMLDKAVVEIVTTIPAQYYASGDEQRAPEEPNADLSESGDEE